MRLDADERSRLARDGFVVRPVSSPPAEVGEMLEACELLIGSRARPSWASPQGRQLRLRSRRDPRRDDQVGRRHRRRARHRAVRASVARARAVGARPALRRTDERLRRLRRADAVHREAQPQAPEHGGVNPLHQDYPYWVDTAEDGRRGRDRDVVPRRRARRATAACGWFPAATRRASGRHAPTATSSPPTRSTGCVRRRRVGAARGPAGSVVMFGPFLVHQSTPNTLVGDSPRAALQLPAARVAAHARVALRDRRCVQVS